MKEDQIQIFVGSWCPKIAPTLMKHGHPEPRDVLLATFYQKSAFISIHVKLGSSAICGSFPFMNLGGGWKTKKKLGFLFAPQPLWLHDSSLEELMFFKLGRWCDFIPVLYHRSSWISGFFLRFTTNRWRCCRIWSTTISCLGSVHYPIKFISWGGRKPPRKLNRI